MGALHDGHLSLAVAPSRMRPRHHHDLREPQAVQQPRRPEEVPKDRGRGRRPLRWVGVEAIFAPAPEEVYPQGFVTNVSVGGVSQPLEGALRPGHFDGVATVVTKLSE